MTTSPLRDPAGARIVERLHTRISDLVDGNHVQGSEVINAGGRSCACHLVYEIEWTFVPLTSESRYQGNVASSTHFGFNQAQYVQETSERCEIGRTHKSVREGFIRQVLARGGIGLANSETVTQVHDFGHHSVHERCAPCSGDGDVTCVPCHGSGRVTCFSCNGRGSNSQTRYVSDYNGQGRHETYQQTCYACGGPGQLPCVGCNGSGRTRCTNCGGHGFFTDVTSVTLRAEPCIRLTVRSELSRDALSVFLDHLPLKEVVHYFDFTQFKHEDSAADKWQVGYEVHSTVAELYFHLRNKFYLAAGVGDKALAFVRPPIFDDIFIEEITDLKKVVASKRKSLSNEKARKFFATYAGQPVLDAAMKSVVGLRGQDRESPGTQVLMACDGYISSASADLLGKSILSLLEKVSPQSSLGSWIGVMTIPFLLMFLGTQNWIENNAPQGYISTFVGWLAVGVLAALVTTLISPVAAFVSAIVSAIHRRAVPAQYRQQGHNWQPLKLFVWTSVAVVTLGGAIGMLSHHKKIPPWGNWPVNLIEETLSLNDFAPYTNFSAALNAAGFFVSPRSSATIQSDLDPIFADIQNKLNRLGYQVAVTGRMDDATQKALNAYAKRKKLKTAEPREVLTSLCKDVPVGCHKGRY